MKNFLKCNFGYRNDRICWKTMILQGSPSHWPISNRKVAQIFLKLNSGAKENDHRKENFEKNAISEAETMEFGQKMMNLLRSPIY